MSKKKKVFILVISIVFLLAVLIVAINYDTIMVIKDGIFETQENISIRKEEENIKQEEILKEAGVTNVRPLTEEESKELVQGNLTEEEVVKIITGQATAEEIKSGQKNEQTEKASEPDASDKQNKGQAPQSKPPEDKKQDAADKKAEEVNNKIAELIGKIYIIEARFTAEVGALEDWAVSEYNKTPKPEKAAKKKELASVGFPKLTELEKSCDAEVNAVLSELNDVLKAAGQNTDIVGQIKSAYNNKKKLTKSYYISEYM